MKAAVLREIGKPFVVEDVPRPVVGRDEVLIETKTCGICRTDIHIQDGLAYVPNLPHIPGHEPAGVVVEVGAAVTKLERGQRVVPHLFVRSGECCYSRAGHDAQALHLEGILGVTLPGAFAEYFKCPDRNLLTLPADVSFESGGLTSCAVITAVHAVGRSGLSQGDTAVVLGPGGIGVMLIQLLVYSGVRVAAVGIADESLHLAEGAGATLTVNSKKTVADEVVAELRKFSGSDGVTAVFELVGHAETMKLATQAVQRRGRVVVIGEEADALPINTIEIAQRELEIVGSRNGGRQDAIRALDFMAAGVIQPPIAARYSLDEFNTAMEAVRQGRVQGRVIVTME
jgi:D-arabinose 1-dehydrogenase-like Zn-dependent alcohol dehydrogenase